MQSKLIAITVLLAFNLNANTLKPFTSDGCSNFPNGNDSNESLWLNCCCQHDLAYWQGGNFSQRFAADDTLAECVTKTGEPIIGNIMRIGVLFGGSAFFPSSFRWGYGWQYGRGYGQLTLDEQHQVEALKPEAACY